MLLLCGSNQAINEVNSNLALLDNQIAEVNQRLVTSQGQGREKFDMSLSASANWNC